MERLRLLLALGAVTALLAGCGSDSDSRGPTEEPWTFQALDLVLDGRAGPEAAGLLTADRLGYFEDLGLGLTITPPLNPERPTQYVAGGSIDVGITHLPQLVLAQEEGAPIVAVGSLVPRPTMGLISLEKSKIDGLRDLKGKTVATLGAPFQEKFLRATLAKAGLKPSDVEVKSTEREVVPELLSGRVDAIFGASANVEGAELELLGAKPVVLPAEALGIPPYDELVVIARRSRLDENPELFRRFMTAVRKGTAAAVDDPATAVEAIDFASYGEAEQKPTEAGLEATLPLLSRSGRISAEQATGLIDWMHEEGMIERKPPASAIAPLGESGS
jgi:putative hydroxymethylpyrimidine transport system substrate-binding protein